MQLKKIKLAGFKSFVDPTTIHFKSNLTAVVGPNGCGKSNIIDATRWVMGESSAKQLRGESMADVIFNGTSTRKPIGQAAIELTFDNASTPLMGEYAKYSEIAIRREVTRDGVSSYYLNNGRCRRKDIVDIFLGTGLGPNSYSVIEQGMISRLIEAKPEELRSYLEEAAGISKYKERRRETENRIRHTRDNLDRLNDIREELARQLRHLKRQANAANRYKGLKQEQRLLKAQLQALHWRIIHEQMVEQEAAIKDKQVELEAKLAQERSIESELEKLRVEQGEAIEIYNEVQGRYYKLGADVGRIEQQIQHNKERCQQLEQDLHQLEKTLQETEHHIHSDKVTITELSTELQNLEPQEERVKEEERLAKQELLLAEETMNEWQYAWDNFNNDAAQNEKQAEVEQTRIEHLQQNIEHETQLLAKLTSETESIDFMELEEDISKIENECNKIKKESEVLKDRLANKHQAITSQREDNNALHNKLNVSRQELQQLHGRCVSLEALQQAALGKNDNAVNNWLEENQLTENSRLAEQIKVETGWEKAVETVLSTHLDAVCVEDIENVARKFDSLAEGHVALFAKNSSGSFSANNSSVLADKVDADIPVADLLGHIYVADDIYEALKIRKDLAPHESVIVKDGVWFGRSWVRVNLAKDDKYGVLQREQEIKDLKSQITEREEYINKHETILNVGRAKLNELEQEARVLQSEYDKIVNNYSDIYGKLNVKQTSLQHLQQRQTKLDQETNEHEQKLLVARQQINTVKQIWSQAEEQKLTHDKKRDNLLEQREQYKEKVEVSRNAANIAQEKASKLLMRLEFVRNKLQYLNQNLERSSGQVADLKKRKEDVYEILINTKSPAEGLEKELAEALQRRLAVENELTTAKQHVDEIAHNLREQEAKRASIERLAQGMQSVLEQLRMEWKALQVRCATYEEQIKEVEFDLQQLLSELPENAELTEWEEKLVYIAKRIERLGPINLAAIKEHEQGSERKKYLDAQNDDLVEALNTLEEAMRKIDRETKSRFKHAFETVNSEFKRLFPIVFGGGKAYLELTSEDLLNTGVFIIAQPPGKRNATIHLLSGGEKALTAIALVFAIFQLNPAPFCMLDEVDAPLDDNNVNRYCNLVKEMSKTVQFIFISHNKITMEMADQLMGVTMHEPGVSRMVSVDIQEALNMAEKRGEKGKA